MSMWKKRNEVQALVLEHLASVGQVISLFDASTRAQLVEANHTKALELCTETHRAEGCADNIRRRVEQAMIQGALLPSRRRQLLEIVEGVDSLANAAEASLDRLLIENLDVPSEIQPFIQQILERSLSIFQFADCAVRSLLRGKMQEVMRYVDQIEQSEGEVDQIERQARGLIFSMSIDLARKLHVSGYLSALVELSDRAEDLSDTIALSVAFLAV